MKGKRIKALDALCRAALDRKAIVYAPLMRRTPAAFLQNLPGVTLNRMLRQGIYEYKKEKNKNA